jgi:NAD(P)-dependent dehydrogenase (short-subunit alcohol dehydrogenase family)
MVKCRPDGVSSREVRSYQEVAHMEVAIVTGASKGLGRALAEGLAARGWSLVIDARGAELLSGVEEDLRSKRAHGAELVAIAGDISTTAHRSELVEAARRLGRLDLIVNNASTLGESPLPRLVDYPLGSLRHVFEVDVLAPLSLVQESIGLLNRATRPRVLNVTSDASIEHYERWGGYGLAKAALDHVSATLGAEDPGLRVWAVDPGDLRTDMHQQAFPGEDISDRPLPESVVQHLVALIESDLPSGRYRASEIAALQGQQGEQGQNVGATR